MNWCKNGGFIVKAGRSTTTRRGKAAIEQHRAILRSIDGDSARGAVSRSVSLYLVEVETMSGLISASPLLRCHVPGIRYHEL